MRIKDGKILVAKKGKPFFPEPIDKDVVVIKEDEEGFLIGPYPEKNTMIMPFNQYHKMLIELRNNCPNAKNWRITALVFIGMFVVMVCLYLHQCLHSHDLVRQIIKIWNKQTTK